MISNEQPFKKFKEGDKKEPKATPTHDKITLLRGKRTLGRDY